MSSRWKVELVLVSALAFAATSSSFGQDASAPGSDPAGKEDPQGLPPLTLTAGNYDAGATARAALGDLRLDALPAPVSTVGIAPLVLGAGGSGGSSSGYVDAKLGAIWFEDDLADLEDGFLAELAFGRRFLPFLGLELFGGYLWSDGEIDGSVDAELWGTSFGVNAKAFIPIPIVEPYAGVGIGGWWLNFEADTPLGNVDDDDLVFGGSIFVGAHVTLGPAFVGVEGRYIQTEDADVFDEHVALKGWAALASLGLEF
jgi:hypothetical protein